MTVIVPDQAKSAGTLFVLGADRIYMGPTSDLGPVDPQLFIGPGNFESAKAIIAAVEDAEKRVQESPDTFPLHASPLSDITAFMVQNARDAMARTGDQLKEAIASASGRDEETVNALAKKLRKPLIEVPQSHGVVISSREAIDRGLPVEEFTSTDPQWQTNWKLYVKYYVLQAYVIVEGQRASRVIKVNQD